MDDQLVRVLGIRKGHVEIDEDTDYRRASGAAAGSAEFTAHVLPASK